MEEETKKRSKTEMKMRFTISMIMTVVFLVAMSAVADSTTSVDDVSATTSTSTTPVVLPVRIPTSSLELESLALSKVYHGVLYGGSAGQVQPGGTTFVNAYVSDPDIRVILNQLTQTTLSFEVGDPSAEQWVGENLMDANGNQLFWGSNQFYPQKDSTGNWVRPDGALRVSLQMAGNIPIASGVTEAHAIISASDGSYFWENLEVNNGQAFYPIWLLGSTGQVIFTPVGGGKPVIYDIVTGGQVVPTPITESVQGSIANLIALDDPRNILFQGLGKAGGEVVNPLYQVSRTSADSVLEVQATAPNGEKAVSVTWRLVGGAPTTAQLIGGRGLLALDPGVYHIWFTFPTWGVDEPVVPLYYNGGMG